MLHSTPAQASLTHLAVELPPSVTTLHSSSGLHSMEAHSLTQAPSLQNASGPQSMPLHGSATHLPCTQI